MGRKVGEEAVMFLVRSRGPPAMRRGGEGNITTALCHHVSINQGHMASS